jgi:hypothetical protein
MRNLPFVAAVMIAVFRPLTLLQAQSKEETVRIPKV